MTTTDFSSLLAAEAGTALPSLTLPVGDYPAIIKAGDIDGVGVHTRHALRGYDIGSAAPNAGATVI